MRNVLLGIAIVGLLLVVASYANAGEKRKCKGGKCSVSTRVDKATTPAATVKTESKAKIESRAKPTAITDTRYAKHRHKERARSGKGFHLRLPRLFPFRNVG